ncbi:hypothetical protein FOL47_002049, partial [Perkinsus chesapeaki]
QPATYEVLPRCGVAYRTSPSFDSKDPRGRCVKHSEVIEAVPVDNSDFVRVKNGLYLPLRSPDGREILRHLHRPAKSTDKTTAYMNSFKDALEAQGVTTDDDPFLNAYASNKDDGLHLQLADKLEAPCGAETFDASGVEDTSSTKLLSRFEAEPVQTDVSDRPLFCISVRENEVAIGCADHGIKIINARTGRQTRELFTKRFGHTEWVTSLTHLPDGRVVSGGMDSKICVWKQNGTACVDLCDHVGSISRLRALKDGSALVSSSYDRTLHIWRPCAGHNFANSAVLRGHAGAVLDFIICPNYGIVSGGRDSTVRIWDIVGGTEAACSRGHSKGHVTALASLGENKLLITGGQDSLVCVWDPRASTRRPLHRLEGLHAKGAAISDIHVTKDGGSVITIGADGIVNVLDTRLGFSTARKWEADHTNFIYASMLLDAQ